MSEALEKKIDDLVAAVNQANIDRAVHFERLNAHITQEEAHQAKLETTLTALDKRLGEVEKKQTLFKGATIGLSFLGGAISSIIFLLTGVKIG